jgi:hypothetical protein
VTTTPDSPDPLRWLPEELEPVALRLARVDECVFMIGVLVSEWSMEGPLDIQQVRRGDEVDIVLRGIRSIPPLVSLLFSEAINHLRAAIDNTVWYLVEREHGPLKGPRAHLVAMPILTREQALDDWVKKCEKAGLTVLGPNAVLGKRVRSLQSFADSATSIPSKNPLLAHLLGEEVEDAHPLLLLQAYSNADKHRAIRVAVARTTSSRHDEPFMAQDRSFKELRVGDVLARTTWGNPVMFDSSTAAVVERPEPFIAPVSPVKELSHLHRYVSQVAIPILVTGLELPHSLPPSVDLGDNDRSARERLCDGSWDDADARLAPIIAERFSEAMNRDARFPDVVDDPGESL